MKKVENQFSYPKRRSWIGCSECSYTISEAGKEIPRITEAKTEVVTTNGVRQLCDHHANVVRGIVRGTSFAVSQDHAWPVCQWDGRVTIDSE